jgi:hypothetical protein
MMLSNSTGQADGWMMNGEPMKTAAPGITEININSQPDQETIIRLKVFAEWVMVEGKAEFICTMSGKKKPVRKIIFDDGTEWVAQK